MSSKHTSPVEGRWYLDRRSDEFGGQWFRIRTAQPEENEANRQLIKAAPLLLAQLERITEAMVDGALGIEHMIQARKAIALAKGEPS